MDSPKGLNSSDNENTSCQAAESPRMCANGCDFFGTSQTRNLCSKCYNDYIRKMMAESVKVVEASSAELQVSSMSKLCIGGVDVNQCQPSKKENCKNKVGLLGFICKCGGRYCASHRYPEDHSCTFDYKAAGRRTLIKENPLVGPDKLPNRI